MTSFLAGGGDGYGFLKEEIIEHTVAGNSTYLDEKSAKWPINLTVSIGIL